MKKESISLETKLKWAPYKDLLITKRPIIVLIFIWSIIVIATWLVSTVNTKSSSNYHIIWTLGSLISIIVFGAFFVLVNTPKLLKMMADSQETKNIKLLFRVTVLIVVILTLAGIVASVMLFFELFYSKEDLFMNLYLENRITVIHILQLTTVLSFLIGDIFSFASINGAKCIMNAKIELRREKSLLWQTLIFVDGPSFITILFLFIFSSSNNLLPSIDTFMGGSEAFALISFNIVYIVIILELGHKYHILTETTT